MESELSTEAPEQAQSTEDQGPATDAPSSAVQPEGQGQSDANETGLYDLSTVPEEYREHVSRIAQDISRNADTKFREAAEYRKTWAPFEERGIHELPIEGLDTLLSFAGSLDPEDPDASRQAIVEFAAALGVDFDTAAAIVEGEEPEPESELAQRLSGVEAALAAQEASAAEATEFSRLQAEWAEVERDHGSEFSEDEATRLRELAQRFIDEDRPIQAAYDFIKSVAAEGATAFVKGAPKQPAGAEPAGDADTHAAPVDDFDTALRLHRERRAPATA